MTSTIDNMLVDAAIFTHMPEEYDRKVADEIVRTIESELDCYGCVDRDTLKKWEFTDELDAALAQFNGQLYDDEGEYCDEETMRDRLMDYAGCMDAMESAWYARNI